MTGLLNEPRRKFVKCPQNLAILFFLLLEWLQGCYRRQRPILVVASSFFCRSCCTSQPWSIWSCLSCPAATTPPSRASPAPSSWSPALNHNNDDNNSKLKPAVATPRTPPTRHSWLPMAAEAAAAAAAEAAASASATLDVQER